MSTIYKSTDAHCFDVYPLTKSIWAELSDLGLQNAPQCITIEDRKGAQRVFKRTNAKRDIEGEIVAYYYRHQDWSLGVFNE